MIEVIHYERANKNKIIGYVDIRIPKWNNMVIRKIAHLQSGDKRWFNLPTFQRIKKDQTVEYLKYWQFDSELHNFQIMECLPEKVKEYCQVHKIEEIKPLSFDQPFDF